MTHIAWVPERWVDAATDTLAGMGERHPSRTILLFPRPDEPRDELDGEVDLRCFVRAGEQGQVCSEVISLQLCGPRANAPASVAVPLLVPDLPVFLRWRGEPDFDGAALRQLSDVADRLVLDSDEWSDCDGTFARLPEIFDRIAVSDIAWGPVTLSGAGVPELEARWVGANAPLLTLVDVREPDEFHGPLGHIPGAESIPLSTLAAGAASLPRERPVVTVCRSGGRSGKAALELATLGFARVASLRGGMVGWTEQQLPVEYGRPPQRDDRQG